MAWRDGPASALDRLIGAVYRELNRLAHRRMRGERQGHSLQTMALLNEAYLRLVDSPEEQWSDQAHLLALSAQLTQRILVDSARARRSAKRGSGKAAFHFDDSIAAFEGRGRDLLAHDEALMEMAAVDPQKARLIDLRFYGGLLMAEIAEVMGITEDAARWNWQMSSAWMFRQLRSESGHAG